MALFATRRVCSPLAFSVKRAKVETQLFFERRLKCALAELGVAGHVCESNRIARVSLFGPGNGLSGFYPEPSSIADLRSPTGNLQTGTPLASVYNAGGEEVTPHGPLTPGLRQAHELTNDSMLAQEDDRAISWLCPCLCVCLPSSGLWSSA